MDRIALLLRADDVKRQIFALLPWNFRLARILTDIAVASGSVNDLGRALGAMFLLAGVTDMPDPGPRWNPKARHPELTLPSGYEAEFVSSVTHILSSKFHDPNVVDAAFNNYIDKLIDGRVKLKPMPRKGAESFVRHGILWEAMNAVRSKLREKGTKSLQDVQDDAKSLSRDLEDPQALKKFEEFEKDMEEAGGKALWKKYEDYLAKHVHPDMPLYMQLRLQGLSNEKIVGAPKKGYPDTMLPHYKEQGHPTKSDPTFWGDKYTKKVKEVTKEFTALYGSPFEYMPGAPEPEAGVEPAYDQSA